MSFWEVLIQICLFVGLENESTLLVPWQKLEKKFGQSPWFVSSTLLENGGVLNASPLKNTDGVNALEPPPLLAEAMNVITCGYEERTEWGKEVISCLSSL